jgi:hypothetical protein
MNGKTWQEQHGHRADSGSSSQNQRQAARNKCYSSTTKIITLSAG